MMKKKMLGLLAGLFTFTVGCGLVYFIRPWIEAHIDGWFFTESVPGPAVMLGLMLTFFLAGYVSARVVKANELRWGLGWSLLTAAFVMGIASWGSDALQRRFFIPSGGVGWDMLRLIALYCLMTIGAALSARDVNRKKKPDSVDVAMEAGGAVKGVAETIYEIFKHH